MALATVTVVNNQVVVTPFGASLLTPLVGQATTAATAAAADAAATAADRVQTGLDRAQTTADAAATAADLADALAIQALGNDAAAIAARVPKNTDGSDFSNPLAVRDAIEARPSDGFVSVADHYLVGDGSDYGPALGRALAASSRVFWPKGASGYTISSLVAHTLTAETVIDWNDVLVTFSGSGRINLTSPVVVASGRTLASNAARWATSIVLNSGTDVQAGDILNIQSSVTPSTDVADNKQDTVRVRSISGATVTLEDGLNFGWDTTEAGLSVTVWRPAGSVTHRRPNFYLDETDGTAVSRLCVYLEGVADWLVDGGKIEGPPTFTRPTNIYRNGVVAYYCHNGLIRDLASRAMSYPVQIAGGSRYVREENTRGRYNHHTNADMGGWSSDYALIGLDDQDSFVALSTHACFRAKATRCNVRNNTAITAWRCAGGAITDSYLHTTDSTSDTVQIQYYAPTAGYEYIYTDKGDFSLSRVKFDNPSRTAVDVYVRYGGRVVVEEIEAYDVRIGSNVVQPVIKLPLKLTGGKAGPTKGLIESTGTQVPAPDVLDAYLDTGVYHIDPYRSLVPQSGRTLRCRGQIARAMAAGAKSVRVHFNGFPGVSAVFLVGRIRVRAILQHQSTGYYSWLEKTWPFFFTGNAVLIEMSTTAVQTIGPHTGASGPDVTLALSSPAVASGTDGYLSFDLTVDKGAAAATSAVYQLEYELELSETS